MHTVNKLLLPFFIAYFHFTDSLCYHGTTANNPATSCQEILIFNPGCYGLSGVYWIQCNGSAQVQQVYCDMDTLQDGWMRVASEKFTNSSLGSGGASCPVNGLTTP